LRKTVIIVVSVAIIASVLFAARVLKWGESKPPQTVQAPAKPATDENAENANSDKKISQPAAAPTFDVVRISREGTGVIAGRSGADNEVQVKADGQVIGTATANSKGEWVVIILDPLKTGPRELTLSARDPKSGAVAESDGVVVVAVPEKKGNGEGEGVVAVLIPNSEDQPSRILQQPENQGAPTVTLTLDTVDYDSQGNAILTGRAESNTSILAYIDNVFIGSVWVPTSGMWRLEPKQEISAGKHILRLDQALGEGDVKIRIELPFDRSNPVDMKLAEGQVIVQPGNSLWHIARRLLGGGTHFVLLYQGNRNQIRDPNLIYPGQVFDLPKPPSNAEPPQPTHPHEIPSR
jgi:nucleoid-associated protein YgaU